MKKITLLAITLLLTITSFSQSFDKIIKATKLQWINEEWKIVSTGYPTDMFVIINQDEITIGKYKFKTYDTPERNIYDTHICYTWKAINGNAEKCLFMMKKFNPNLTTHMIYTIVYTNLQIMYEYESE